MSSRPTGWVLDLRFLGREPVGGKIVCDARRKAVTNTLL